MGKRNPTRLEIGRMAWKRWKNGLSVTPMQRKAMEDYLKAPKVRARRSADSLRRYVKEDKFQRRLL